jgi:pleiotropic regulator 1
MSDTAAAAAATTTTATTTMLAAESARLSLKRARDLFANSTAIPRDDPKLRDAAIARRLHTQYNQTVSSPSTTGTSNASDAIVVSTITDPSSTIAAATANPSAATATTGVLARLEERQQQQELHKPVGILTTTTSGASLTQVPTPSWHAPWKLATVLSSHLGWVRSVAMDPTNDMFATGGADRVIKVWDLAKASVGSEQALKITLTGHISPVRGLAFSDRHPYLFSCGEDKQIKCWDLETNQVIRHYHGHLSGIFCLALHPTLDVLVTGGRDAVARVWDMRSKTQIHCLSGHDNTVASVLTKATDPQIITGSMDTTIKLWDLVAGKCMSTLTHHQKSVRALTQPTFQNTFVSGAADGLKKWQGRDGRFLKTMTGHDAVINALAVNDDGVLMSGGDDGSMRFWDYQTGYCFQDTSSKAQPGSLDAENGIYASTFDLTGTRLITCEADKTVKIWKQDEDASELSHPVDMVEWRKKCLREAKERY